MIDHLPTWWWVAVAVVLLLVIGGYRARGEVGEAAAPELDPPEEPEEEPPAPWLARDEFSAAMTAWLGSVHGAILSTELAQALTQERQLWATRADLEHALAIQIHQQRALEELAKHVGEDYVLANRHEPMVASYCRRELDQGGELHAHVLGIVREELERLALARATRRRGSVRRRKPALKKRRAR